MFRKEYEEPISEVAKRLSIPYSWLYGLIAFESNFDPQAKNPYSSARGLIQVIDSTAKSVFRVNDSLELVSRFPSFNEQIHNVVYPYLKQFFPFPTKQSLYMAVFFPLARNVPPETTFYDIYKSNSAKFKNWIESYKIFARQNPGIRTVADYVDRVDGIIARIAGVPIPSPKRYPLPYLVTAGVVIGIVTLKMNKKTVNLKSR